MTGKLPKTGKLGFGLMRLPKKGGKIDVPVVRDMCSTFLDAGFNYFDTAYVYRGSEAAAKEALVEGRPRESFLLATKINAFLSLPTEKAVKKQFRKSLERTGAGYFDFYLLHALMNSNYRMYNRYNLWEFAQEQKAKGLIRHVGFSFHGTPSLLDSLLKEHPETEFVQLQLNYADWNSRSIASRENYEIARKHDVPIIVMEPVKGGTLARPPAKVRALMDEAAPGRSYASWALRYAASLEGVYTVLSGMSSMEQLEDNISFMRDFEPLSNEEQEVIREAQKILGKSTAIPCTGCRYCVGDCPKDIQIPDIFAAANTRLTGGQIHAADEQYKKAIEGHGSAADCIECGRCEMACPQNIRVRDELKRSRIVLDK